MSVKELWERFGGALGTTIVHPQFFAKREAQVGRELAVRYARGVVLDIGPGAAPYRAAIERKVRRYLTLDHPQAARFYAPGFALDFVSDASERIPLKPQSVDTVILLMVLEHLPNPQRALAEIERVLKPGGVLVLSTIQTYPLHDPPFDYFRYTEFALRGLLKEAGLRVRILKSQGSFVTTLVILVNVQLFGSLRALGQFPGGVVLAALLGVPALGLAMALNVFGILGGWLDPLKRLRHSHVVVAYKPRKARRR